MKVRWAIEAEPRVSVPLFEVREGRPVEPQLQRSAEGGGQRVRVIGGEGAEVLYDARGNWVGFSTTGDDGSAVRYEKA